MTPDEKLAAFLAGEPARPDPAFSAAVMARVARRRAWLSVAAGTPWAVTGGLVLWALLPVLARPADRFATGLGEGLGPAAAVMALTLAGLGLARLAAARLRPGA